MTERQCASSSVCRQMGSRHIYPIELHVASSIISLCMWGRELTQRAGPCTSTLPPDGGGEEREGRSEQLQWPCVHGRLPLGGTIGTLAVSSAAEGINLRSCICPYQGGVQGLRPAHRVWLRRLQAAPQIAAFKQAS
jgi:hypothetical protein